MAGGEWLDDAEIAAMQQGIAQAHLATAKLQHVGGPTWEVSSPGGTGIGGSPVPVSKGTVNAWVFLQTTAVAEQAGAQTATDTTWVVEAKPEWYAATEADNGLRSGRTIRSTATGIRFRIQGEMEVYPDFVRGALERA